MLRWLTTVVIDYNSPSSNSKKFQEVFPWSLTVCLSLSPFYVTLEQFKCQQMAKMNDQVPKERLGTSRLTDVFLKISGIRNWL